MSTLFCFSEGSPHPAHTAGKGSQAPPLEERRGGELGDTAGKHEVWVLLVCSHKNEMSIVGGVCELIIEMTSHHLCSVPLVRSKSYVLPTLRRED